MLKTYLRAMEQPIAPRVVSTGPVKDVILTGDRINLLELPQIVHHEGDAGAYITAAISFAKDPTGSDWNCAYNRLMIKGRDTTSIHLTAGKHLWEYQRHRGGPGRAVAGGLRHRRAPGDRAGRARHRLHRRGRAGHHGRALRRAARAGQVRDLRRARARSRRAGDRGRDPAGRAHARGPVRRVHRLQPGRASARGVAGQGRHPSRGRHVPGHHGGAPRPHAAVHHPDGGEPLPRRARDGAVGEGGARARALHLLRLDRAALCPARPRTPSSPSSAPICT